MRSPPPLPLASRTKNFKSASEAAWGWGWWVLLLKLPGIQTTLDIHGHYRSACDRTARLYARHRLLVSGWRQELQEAGRQVPVRKIKRLLRDIHLQLLSGDGRRMDILTTGTSVARGLPIFGDITCVSPISGHGLARAGATTIDGVILHNARQENQNNYPEVDETGLRLYCVDVEVFGRWREDSLPLVRDLARERYRTLPPAIAQASRTARLRRWRGLLIAKIQRTVSPNILRWAGSDLTESVLDPPPGLTDLPI
jgi:hypothetical protein